MVLVPEVDIKEGILHHEECVEEQKIRVLYNKIETPALKKLALSQIKCIAEIENSINYE